MLAQVIESAREPVLLTLKACYVAVRGGVLTLEAAVPADLSNEVTTPDRFIEPVYFQVHVPTQDRAVDLARHVGVSSVLSIFYE